MSDNDYKERYKKYKEKYYHEKNKNEEEWKSKKDVSNPIVNVNVNCCDHKKESTGPSAFRAAASTSQAIGPADITQIMYPDQEFDLNNEYDPGTSTFEPKQDGIYLIIASLAFVPDVAANYSVRMFIVINDVNVAAADNDFFGAPLTNNNHVSVSTITKLFKGDRVQIFAQAIIDGNTDPDPSFNHFEAARFRL